MCGFFAVIGPRGTLPGDDACRRALDTLAARGPDGEGLRREVFGDLEVVMGHRRLAIVGVADGSQPIVSDLAMAVVNGEFYGHRAVRARLERAGARFSTRSDSEILPRLYDADGGAQSPGGGPGNWLRDLCGEWSFALVDRRDGTLWAACDPSGTKPLRWWASPDSRTVMLASEAKALFALGAPRELDEEALRFALALQYLPYGRTLFRGIRMLPPGSWLRASEGTVATGQLWDHFAQRPLLGREGRDADCATAFPWLSQRELDAVEVALRPGAGRLAKVSALRALVEGAVARRLPTERDFCTHLSGGVDSAIVTALAARLTGRRVDGYCASFPWAGTGDETEAAAVSARAIGAELRPVVMSPAALLTAMDEAPLRSEGLSINMHAGAKILVADAISQAGHRVAFTGEGADEAFLGYEHFRWDFPEGQRPPSADVNPASVGIMRPDGKPREDLGALAGVLGGTVPSWVSTKAAAADLLVPVLGGRLRDVAFRPEELALGLPIGVLGGAHAVGPVGRARALWSVYCMSGYILRGLDDAMGMARGVESRLAFLDPAIQWFAAQLPDGEHYGVDGLEKGLLREAMTDLLPECVLRRPKRAFLAPSLLDSDIGRVWARDRILGGGLVSRGLLTEAGVRELLEAPQRPVRDAAILTLASLSGVIDAFDLA